MRISDWSSDVCSSDLPVTKSLFHIARYLNQNPNLSGLPIIFEMKVVVRTAPVLEHHVVARAQRLLEDAGPFDARVSLAASQRSEEHTSELQSLMRISYAVFCLKKKHTNKNITICR